MCAKNIRMTSILNQTSNRNSKRPSSLACISCRKSHVKCDGKQPLCGRCAERDSQCIWMESRRGYRDTRKSRQNDNDGNLEDAPASEEQPGVMLEEASLIDPVLPTPSTLFQPISQYSYSTTSQNSDPKSMSESTITQFPTQFTVEDSAISTTITPPLSKPDSLIDAFYKYFYPSHPFIIPRNAYSQAPSFLPESLLAVMRYVGSFYISRANQPALEREARSALSDNASDNGFKVQALILVSIASSARIEIPDGIKHFEKALEIAIRIGMNQRSFALKHGQNNPTVEESWRRTWWTLYSIDALFTAIGQNSQLFRLYNTPTDVLLPGHCEDYNQCRPSPTLKTLSELQHRAFSEENFKYSSMAYGVEATNIMGRVLHLSQDNFNTLESEVENIDTAISSFLLSLPAEKREIVSSSGIVDEVLAFTHMMIHWAAVLLHRPRSSLTFIHNHYRTACTSRRPTISLPSLPYSSHDAKVLRSANSIVSLAAVPRQLPTCTPCLMCGLTTAATVHLPAYAIGFASHSAIKERMRLTLAALGSLGETWPRALVAKSQVASFAREVLERPPITLDQNAQSEKLDFPIPPPMLMPNLEKEALGIEGVMPADADLSTAWFDSLMRTTMDDDGITMAADPSDDLFSLWNSQT